MTSPDKFEIEEVKELVCSALKSLYKYDAVLYKFETDDSYINERCLSFRIGLYMYEEIKNNCKYAGYDIDSEYNRHLNDVKRASKNKDECIIPDILIHKRKNDDNNLLLIEIKKDTSRDDDGFLKDIHVLKNLTLQTPPDNINRYKYKFGMHIILGESNAIIYVYQNGNFCKDDSFMFSQKEISKLTKDEIDAYNEKVQESK